MSASMNLKSCSHFPELVQLSKNESGKKLICIHQSGGDIGIYRKLVRYIDPAVSAIGIQSRLVFGQDNEFETVEEMSAHYSAIVSEICSDEDIQLLGFSFGGFVASAITNRLRLVGRDVTFLGLIDCGLDWTGDGEGTREEIVTRLMEVSFHFQKIGLLNSVDRTQVRCDVEQIVDRCLGSERVSADELMDELTQRGYQTRTASDQQLLMKFIFNFLTHCNMLRQFQPTFVDTDMHLWWPSEINNKNRGDQWRALCKNTIQSTISGSHYTIMREPHVREIALQINQAMGLSSRRMF